MALPSVLLIKPVAGQWKSALTATATEAALIPSDVWECNGRVFINGAGFGFEACVVAKMIAGRRSYYWQAVRQMMRWRPFTADITTDEWRMTGELTNLSLMNGVFADGGFRLAPLAKLDDGKLDLIAVGGMHPWEKLIYLPLSRRGAHLKLKGVTFRQVTQARMVCDRDLPWHVDGESMDPVREFVITRRNETMLFRRPKATPEVRA